MPPRRKKVIETVERKNTSSYSPRRSIDKTYNGKGQSSRLFSSLSRKISSAHNERYSLSNVSKILVAGVMCGMIITGGHRLIEPVYGNVFSYAADVCLQAVSIASLVVSAIISPYIFPKQDILNNTRASTRDIVIVLSVACSCAWVSALLLKTKTIHSWLNVNPTQPYVVAYKSGLMLLGTPITLLSISAGFTSDWLQSRSAILVYLWFGVGWILGEIAASTLALQTFGQGGSVEGMFGTSVCTATVTLGVWVMILGTLWLWLIIRTRHSRDHMPPWVTRTAYVVMLVGVVGLINSAMFSPFCNPEYIHVGRYQLVERNESNTGIISVINDAERGIVVMKADHSILGGSFTHLPLSSVFAIFHTHEAVRLAVTESGLPVMNERLYFLQIGLGVGVVAAAMQRHNCHVDVVEIDPAVVRLADAHFDYKMNYKPGNAYSEDAISWLESRNQQGNNGISYDMVVHDVFTGGSMPSALFCIEIFSSIQKTMANTGVLAVNYFGYIDGEEAEDTRLVVRTLLNVFDYVRTFSDEYNGSAHNLVFFASNTPINFRKAVDQDYLGSSMRVKELNSLTEREVTILPYQKASDTEKREMGKPSPVISEDYNPLSTLDKKYASAAFHFKAMRDIFDVNDFWIEYM